MWYNTLNSVKIMPEIQPEGFRVHRDKPLIGVVSHEGDEEIIRYFTDEQEVEDTSDQTSIQRALHLAGAWQDMDWTEAETTLDQIRHQSKPTPPLEL